MQYSDFLNRRLRCQVIFEAILTLFILGYLAIFVPEPIGEGEEGGGADFVHPWELQQH